MWNKPVFDRKQKLLIVYSQPAETNRKPDLNMGEMLEIEICISISR